MIRGKDIGSLLPDRNSHAVSDCALFRNKISSIFLLNMLSAGVRGTSLEVMKKHAPMAPAFVSADNHSAPHSAEGFRCGEIHGSVIRNNNIQEEMYGQDPR